MGLFDNATSVLFNNKEVASMKVGDDVLYEKISSNNSGNTPKITLIVDDTFEQATSRNPFDCTGDVTIDWGDGSELETYDGESRLDHDFVTNDTFEVSVYGNITGIVEDGFYENVGVLKVIFFNSITSIGGTAFESCVNLSEVTFESTTPPELGSDVFKYLEQNITIKVPQGSLSAYQNAENYPTGANFTYVEY